jgi:hypothetical protein
LLAAAGAAFWLAPGPPPATLDRDGEASGWVLPPLPPQEMAAAAYARLQQSRPWGEAGQSSAPTTGAPSNWRLRGVVQAGEQRHALIEETGGKPRRYRAGDVLPLGEKLVAVHADRIDIKSSDGEARSVVLYRPPAGPDKK